MDHEVEFPDIIKLNVGGIHYTTLLSTLTKDADSKLAAMFTGTLPVYKDKDDRYFLDGDGKLFQYILDYLRADVLPYQIIPNTGGFGFGGPTNFPNGIDKTFMALYKEAVLFGLEGLVCHLERYKGIYVEKQLESFRESKAGYDECMSSILQSVPIKSMLGSSYTIVVLKQIMDGQPARCCEHTCTYNYPSNSFFKPPQVFQKDLAIVEVPFVMDHTVLNCLYIDLTRIGFSVNCGMTECNFLCEKEPRNVFGSSPFGPRARRQCCGEPVYYIQINWSLAPFGAAFINQGFSFGGGQTVSSPFGGQAGFGSKAQTGCFGNPQSNKGGGSLFGSQQSNADQQNSQVFFGFGQSGFGQSGTAGGGNPFGSQQSSFGQTGSFGSQQNSQTGSGFGQSGVIWGGGTFGSQQSSSGQTGLFGSQQNSQTGFGFGQSGGGGTFGSQQSSSGQTGLFGSQQNSQTGFGFGQSGVGGEGGTLGPQQSSSGQTGIGGVFGSGNKTVSGQSSFTFAGQAKGNQSSGFTFGQASQNQHGQVKEKKSVFSLGSSGFGNQPKQGLSQEASGQSSQSSTQVTKAGFSFGQPSLFGQPVSTGQQEESTSTQNQMFNQLPDDKI